MASRVSATEVVIAMPSAPGHVIREVVRQASDCGLVTRTVPGTLRAPFRREVGQFAAKDRDRGHPAARTDQDRHRAGERARDGARRDGDRARVARSAASSAGSWPALDPAAIIAVGRGENSIFDIVQELGRSLSQDPAGAGDRRRARSRAACAVIFASARPNSVFHAAAHKHVPLMEAQPRARRSRTTCCGTRNVADAGGRHGVRALRADLHRQGGQPDQRDGRHQARGRAASCRQLRRRQRTALRRRALRQRAGQPRQRGAASSSEQIAARRAGHGHPPGHDALLHDHPRGGAAGAAGRRAWARAARSSCSTWASRCASSTWPRDLIRLSGLRARAWTSRSSSPACGPGEKLFEELFFHGEDAEPTEPPEDPARARCGGVESQRRRHRPADRGGAGESVGHRDPAIDPPAGAGVRGGAGHWRVCDPGARRGVRAAGEAARCSRGGGPQDAGPGAGGARRGGTAARRRGRRQQDRSVVRGIARPGAGNRCNRWRFPRWRPTLGDSVRFHLDIVSAEDRLGVLHSAAKPWPPSGTRQVERRACLRALGKALDASRPPA